MKFSPPIKFVFVILAGILTTLAFIESAQASGGPAAIGFAILVVYLINVVFNVLMLSFFILGILLWHRKPQVAIWYILLATLPFLHYAIEVVHAEFEPNHRSQQIADLTQQQFAANTLPRSIETTGFEGKEVAELVAVGVLDEVQAVYKNQNLTTVFKLKESPECIDFETSGGAQAEFRRVVLARYAFQRCVQQTQLEGIANTPIQLLTGKNAPSRYIGPACLGGGNHPLELRWTPQHGGKLIAFWESPSFIAHAFPPFLFGDNGKIWQCKDISSESPDYHFPDKFKFVSSALGFKKITDFPKSSDASIVPKALDQLITKMNSRYAHDHVLALLGQWPSSRAIDEALNAPQVYAHSNYILQKASVLLTDPSEEERRNNLYPNLSTHLPTLLKICSHHALARKDHEKLILDSCSKLTSVAKRKSATPD
jgi:hypothetical protein